MVKALILAAGRGSRFGHLSCTIPKPLIVVAGKPLIRHTLDVLPREVTECIIVLGYLGELIQCELGNQYRQLPLTYVQQIARGTGGALLSAAHLLCKDKCFLVVGSDDIFGKGELSKLICNCPSYGVVYGVPTKTSTGRIIFDEWGRLVRFETVSDPSEPRYFGVGAYVLPNTVFGGRFSRLPNGEFSIPHTLVHAPFVVYVAFIRDWLPVNTFEEKAKAELQLSKISRQDIETDISID